MFKVHNEYKIPIISKKLVQITSHLKSKNSFQNAVIYSIQYGMGPFKRSRENHVCQITTISKNLFNYLKVVKKTCKQAQMPSGDMQIALVCLDPSWDQRTGHRGRQEILKISCTLGTQYLKVLWARITRTMPEGCSPIAWSWDAQA